jgi:excisionase family DNA binding protein
MDRLLLTFAEAGVLLSLAERSGRRLVAEGKLRAVDTGRGSTRIRRADLEAYVAGLSSSRPMSEQITTKGAAG